MLDKLVIALISPLGTALFLGFFAVVLLVFSLRVRLATTLGVCAFTWLYFWSLPVVSNQMRAFVEAASPPVSISSIPHAQAIVVLGGSLQPAWYEGGYPQLTDASDRVWHSARLYHAGKAPMLLLSGGSEPHYSISSEASSMQEFLRDLGVPNEAILLEERSRNTRQNAQFTADILLHQGIDHIILVTSALHMKRASTLFTTQGFTVIPAPTDHQPQYIFSKLDFIPSTGALDVSARTIKEIVGKAFNK